MIAFKAADLSSPRATSSSVAFLSCARLIGPANTVLKLEANSAFGFTKDTSAAAQTELYLVPQPDYHTLHFEETWIASSMCALEGRKKCQVERAKQG